MIREFRRIMVTSEGCQRVQFIIVGAIIMDRTITILTVVRSKIFLVILTLNVLFRLYRHDQRYTNTQIQAFVSDSDFFSLT